MTISIDSSDKESSSMSDTSYCDDNCEVEDPIAVRVRTIIQEVIKLKKISAPVNLQMQNSDYEDKTNSSFSEDDDRKP